MNIFAGALIFLFTMTALMALATEGDAGDVEQSFQCGSARIQLTRVSLPVLDSSASVDAMYYEASYGAETEEGLAQRSIVAGTLIRYRTSVGWLMFKEDGTVSLSGNHAVPGVKVCKRT
ncbi:MAG: hypothetical protein AB7G93_09815 [Bdellovibrionales bacterium]